MVSYGFDESDFIAVLQNALLVWQSGPLDGLHIIYTKMSYHFRIIRTEHYWSVGLSLPQTPDQIYIRVELEKFKCRRYRTLLQSLDNSTVQSQLPAGLMVEHEMLSTNALIGWGVSNLESCGGRVKPGQGFASWLWRNAHSVEIKAQSVVSESLQKRKLVRPVNLRLKNLEVLNLII